MLIERLLDQAQQFRLVDEICSITDNLHGLPVDGDTDGLLGAPAAEPGPERRNEGCGYATRADSHTDQFECASEFFRLCWPALSPHEPLKISLAAQPLEERCEVFSWRPGLQAYLNFHPVKPPWLLAIFSG
jgi:hypothetical protein